MSADDEWKRATKGEWLVALALIAAGMAISALAMGEIRASKPERQLAQATPQAPRQQSAPPAKNDTLVESEPGGTRPTTPAPEPARPNPEAQKKAGQPVQPQRPAEKYGPPIKEK
jgi:hypothetical protein